MLTSNLLDGLEQSSPPRHPPNPYDIPSTVVVEFVAGALPSYSSGMTHSRGHIAKQGNMHATSQSKLSVCAHMSCRAWSKIPLVEHDDWTG